MQISFKYFYQYLPNLFSYPQNINAKIARKLINYYYLKKYKKIRQKFCLIFFEY